MSSATEESRNTHTEFTHFLMGMGKTLSRINLYPLTHPLVVESIRDSFTHLANSFSQEQELTVAIAEEKLLLNGAPLSALGTLQNVLENQFQKYQIHSLTFKSGISTEELTSFYKLFTTRPDLIKDVEAIRVFFQNEKVLHIEPDMAFFAKVTSKDKKTAEPYSGSGRSSEAQKTEISQFINGLQEKSLDSMMWEIIQKAIPNPEDQKKVFDIIFKQIENELHQHVEKATHQLKQEKQQITNEKERTESVINNIADGIVVVDQSGKIIMMNPTAERIYGANFSEIKGKQLLETSKNELMISLSKDLVVSPEKGVSKEMVIQSENETQQIIKNSTATIKDPEGKIVGIMTILNDIAKQKELQRMQTDFMAHVTHELRSPLTAIKAALGTIDDANPQQQHILTIANRNIDRLARLINDLLDCTKIESGKMTVYPKPFDSAALLKDVVRSLEPWAQNKSIALLLELPAALPAVSADYDRITQVLVNLISNAIKFTPKDGKIFVRAQPAGTIYLKITVTDTGPGIPKKDQARVFERFFQLQQTVKTDAPGTGLGLTIAKSIVELHKGEIGFESEEGKGTTFYFTLPIVPNAQPSQSIPVGEPKKKKSWLSKLFGK